MSWKWAEQFDDLGNVIVILAVLGSGLWIKEIIAGYEFENLFIVSTYNRLELTATHHCGHTPNVSAGAPL